MGSCRHSQDAAERACSQAAPATSSGQQPVHVSSSHKPSKLGGGGTLTGSRPRAAANLGQGRGQETALDLQASSTSLVPAPSTHHIHFSACFTIVFCSHGGGGHAPHQQAGPAEGRPSQVSAVLSELVLVQSRQDGRTAVLCMGRSHAAMPAWPMHQGQLQKG